MNVNRVKSWRISKKSIVGVVAVVLALILYLVGFTYALFPVLVVALAYFTPCPAVFRSYFSRIWVSIALFYAVYQLCTVIFFLLSPRLVFSHGAIIMSLLACLLIVVCQKPRSIPVVPFSKSDACGILVALAFVLPIAGFAYAKNGSTHIAQIGSIQAIDGVNHYTYITEATNSEHIVYRKGNYYPVGFHLTTGFIEDSLGIPHSKLSWEAGANTYVAEYLASAFMLLYFCYYLFLALVQAFGRTLTARSELGAALAIGPPLAVFYMIGFLYNGFLNYLYICATIILGLIFIAQSISARASGEYSKKQCKALLASVTTVSLLFFGASSSWPLLVPALVGCMLLWALPPLFAAVRRRHYPVTFTVTIAMAILLQLVPVYLQLRFATVGTKDGINTPGSLTVFFSALFAANIVGLLLLANAKNATPQVRLLVDRALQPIALFLAALVAYQYFTVGEVRYYVIKSIFLLNIIVFVVLTAWLFSALQTDEFGLSKLAVVICAPAFVLFALLAINGNPLQDARSLFRTQSGLSKPQYFDEDIQALLKLADSGKLQGYNTSVVHYDQDKGKFFGDIQVPYWFNAAHYSAQNGTGKSKQCAMDIYKNLLFGDFSEQMQQAFERKTERCAHLANRAKTKYYIVTDKESQSYVDQAFGAYATIAVD